MNFEENNFHHAIYVEGWMMLQRQQLDDAKQDKKNLTTIIHQFSFGFALFIPSN